MVKTGGASRRLAPPLDQSRKKVGAVTAVVNLMICALILTSYLWRCVTGAHQPCHWAGRPQSGRGQGVHLDRWAKTDEINSNILSLDLILYFKL
jgi:hypothetical protein